MTYHIHWHIQEIEKAFQSGDNVAIVNELKNMAYMTVGYESHIKTLLVIVRDFAKGDIDSEEFADFWNDDFTNGLKYKVENEE